MAHILDGLVDPLSKMESSLADSVDEVGIRMILAKVVYSSSTVLQD